MINDLLPFIVTGLATGSVFALAAMGLVLTFKTSGVFNFAHGAVAAVGAYVMWELWATRGWPWPLALGAAVLSAGVVGGFVLERIAVGLADKPPALKVVATVGVLIAVQGLIVIRYGAASIPMQFFLPDETVGLADVRIRYEQIIVFALAAVVAIGLSAFFKRSRLGVAMQGVVDDPALVGLQGISPTAVRRSAWIVGSCFAAASGALLAPTLNLDATLLTLLVVQAFGAAAIGRFSSLPLTYAGGLVIGLGQEVLKYVVSRDALVDNFSPQILGPLPSNLPFLVLFVVLVATPRTALVERGSATVKLARAARPWSRRSSLVAGALALGGAIALPHVVNGSRLPTYTSALAFVVIFASLHLLVRTSGQVSLCQMAFAAIGAAASVHLQDWGVAFPVAVLLAGLITVPVGAFISIPAVRLSGVYLAIATFGFGILVERIVFPSSLLFGSQQALPAPRPSFATGDVAYYHVVLVVAVLATVAVAAVRRARLGRLLRGLAESPDAVSAHGTSTNTIRLASFVIAAFLAAIGGALLVPVTGSATGGTFNFSVSLTLLTVLMIAGRRAASAPFIAAAAYIVVPGYVQSAELLELLPVAFGVAALLAATGLPTRAWNAWRASPRALERTATSPRRARRAAIEAVAP